MAPRFSASQLRNKMRQRQQKFKQAVDKYNRGVRQRNQAVHQAVNKYNQGVKAHNSRVHANRQRLRQLLTRFSQQKTTTRYAIYTASAKTLHESYTRLDASSESHQLDPRYNRVLDLSERETANSLDVANQLQEVNSIADEYNDELQDAQLAQQLSDISPDLDGRWRGAVFALNPNNPDAARHFCTSAREIFTQILETKAPDREVFLLLPNCDITDRGNPTRRSRIRYFLQRKGLVGLALEDFVENDMQNIVELFDVFNEGTHGSAGTYDMRQLTAIKKRVEDGIVFLCEIVKEA